MPLVTETDIRVRSPDQDAQGWVNNARYAEYFGEGRLDHMDRLRAQADVPGTFTLAELLIQYKAPARHRDLLRVRVWTKDIRTRSFTLAIEIVKADTGQLVAQGHSAQVWLIDGAPAPIPDGLRQVLEGSMA
jgi:acyl-CoA thioester hydrolase